MNSIHYTLKDIKTSTFYMKKLLSNNFFTRIFMFNNTKLTIFYHTQNHLFWFHKPVKIIVVIINISFLFWWNKQVFHIFTTVVKWSLCCFFFHETQWLRLYFTKTEIHKNQLSQWQTVQNVTRFDVIVTNVEWVHFQKRFLQLFEVF